MDKLVIIPTYNEKENIERIILKVLSLAGGYHVLIVDDGSPDGTASIVRKLMNTIQWAQEHTGINFASAKTDIYQKLYAGDAVDIRNSFKPGVERSAWPANSALYYQLFAERNGFYPNLSILDLLFSEGPAVSSFIREHRETIRGWQAG